MIARKPVLALEEAAIVWSQIPEFSITWSGASVLIPYVEHYLNNVISEVKSSYGPANPALQAELETFIQQEAAHSRYHIRYNRQMEAAGYDALKPLVERLVGELRAMRAKRSLAFNVAYCAGFENGATFTALYLLTKCDALFAGAEPNGANLLLWHVAEEYEHRAVCHEAFHAVSGSYFIRLAGLLYAFWHINASFGRATKVIMDRHRATMTSAQRRESIRTERRLKRRQLAFAMPRMLRLLMPNFNPARLPVPPWVQAVLDFFAGESAVRTVAVSSPQMLRAA